MFHQLTAKVKRQQADRLEKPGIEPTDPGLQGEWFIYYTEPIMILQEYTTFDLIHEEFNVKF